jgi:hypothetical protein
VITKRAPADYAEALVHLAVAEFGAEFGDGAPEACCPAVVVPLVAWLCRAVVEEFHLCAELDQVARSVVEHDEEGVADSVPTGAPGDWYVLAGEMVAPEFELVPPGDVEREVVEPVAPFPLEDGQRVVRPLGADPEAGSPAHRVGDAETEHLSIEAGQARCVRGREGEVLDAVGPQAAGLLAAAVDGAVKLDPVAVGVRDGEGPGVDLPVARRQERGTGRQQTGPQGRQFVFVAHLEGEVVEADIAADDLHGMVAAAEAQADGLGAGRRAGRLPGQAQGGLVEGGRRLGVGRPEGEVGQGRLDHRCTPREGAQDVTDCSRPGTAAGADCSASPQTRSSSRCTSAGIVWPRQATCWSGRTSTYRAP